MLWRRTAPPRENLIPPYPSTGTWPYIDSNGTYGPTGKAYPQSRHTYGGSIIIPGVGIWIGGGVSWHPYNIVQTNIQKTWHATSSGWQGPFDLVGSYETVWGAWDPLKSRVLFQDNDRLRAYDPAKPAGSRVVAIDDGSQPSDSRNRFCSGAFDSKRNRLVGACVKSVSDGTPTLEGFNLSLSPTKRQIFIASAPWPAWTTAPGLLYDPVGDKYVLWPNGGQKLYIIDPVTFGVSNLVGTGADPGYSTIPSYAGTWGRFAYVSGDDLYIAAHKVTGPAYAFKPDRSGTLAPVLTFSASPTTITSGQSTTLSWSASDATSCTASDSWSGTKATSGNQAVSPAATSTYTLTCTGPGGTTTQSTMVIVTAATDTIAPVVSITSPSVGATVFNTTTVTASASDNIEVVGVQFKLDSTALGIEDTTSPYSVSWDTKTAANGAHTLTATARDVAGNVATDSVGVTVSNSVDSTPGQIDIPTGVFMAVQLPYRGQGIGYNKHVTLAWNPLDGRLYSVGGDFGGLAHEQSYRQDMFSLSIKDKWDDKTNPAAGWRLEQPYCRTDGTIQPKHPDFVGWTWDNKRNVFWMVPGTMEIASDNCAGETGSRASDPLFLAYHVMTFDPVTKKWTNQTSDTGPNVAETWKSHYDNESDSLIRFGWDGGLGAVANIYSIPTKTWSKFGLGVNALGKDIRVNKEGSDTDSEKKQIYTVDGCSGRLHRYSIATKKIADLGPVPGGSISGCTTTNDAYVAWDSIHKVLFFWRLDTSTLHVYEPANSTWQNISTVTSPGGLTPSVRHAFVFDPGQNVLVMVGSTDTSNNNMYLFRYAPGVGVPITPPVPSIILSASQTSVDAGSMVTLTWSTTDASSCTAAGAWTGTKTISGSQTVNPASTSTYTLTCTGAGGSVNKSVTITVNAPSIAGDINGDKKVDILDVVMVASYFGKTTFDSKADAAPPFGIIDIFDVMVVVVNWSP